MFKEILPDDYKQTLKELVTRVQQARYNSLKAISRENISMYWDLGKVVSQKVKSANWGSKVVEQIAKDLQIEFPGVRGFSVRNLWYMKSFYEEYSCHEILQPLVAQIGWAHNKTIFEKCRCIFWH